MRDDTSFHNPPFAITKMLDWLNKAQIDYVDAYVKLYIAYNAWYKEAVGTSNDREAIDRLKKRFVIWYDYQNGKAMKTLRPFIEQIAEITQRKPLPVVTTRWSGEVNDSDDWQSLIEYWYRIRCLIIHGEAVDEQYVYLAYESLSRFMAEIVKRTEECLDSYKLNEAVELKKMAKRANEIPHRSEKFLRLQQKLYLKYASLPNVWEVDMISV